MKGLTSKVLDHHGKHFTVDNVPMELEPLQKPHPPIWYGVHMPDSAERAARRNLNVVSLDPPAETRLSIDRYRQIWPQVHAPTVPFPKLGLGRFVVVAPTDAEAVALARRAYPVWHASFTHLFRRHGRTQSHPRPATFDLVMERGQGIAGSPQTVAKVLGEQLAHTGCNYMVGQFTFGDLTLAEGLRSIGLFADEVMPALRAKATAAGTIAAPVDMHRSIRELGRLPPRLRGAAERGSVERVSRVSSTRMRVPRVFARTTRRSA